MRVSVVGGSGYVGGELVRLLLHHPEIEIQQVTSSSRNKGKYIHHIHPNLRKRTRLKFSTLEELEECDFLFLCLPHGFSMKKIDQFLNLSEKIVDLSSDFRLKDKEKYKEYYGKKHERPGLLKKFVYGIPELHRKEMEKANLVSSAGCNATSVILSLYPLSQKNLVEKTVVEAKVGSSEGGNKPSLASHHPERSRAVRSYQPTLHRHTVEMEQELEEEIHFSATSIEMVRGILATCHVFLKNENLKEKNIWKIYREFYQEEPFIRIVKYSKGVYRYPEPKILIGSNYCDIGFEKDKNSSRLVVMSALDNLMKGAAGQALQAFNIMNDFPETLGLEFPGLHPI